MLTYTAVKVSQADALRAGICIQCIHMRTVDINIGHSQLKRYTAINYSCMNTLDKYTCSQPQLAGTASQLYIWKRSYACLVENIVWGQWSQQNMVATKNDEQILVFTWSTRWWPLIILVLTNNDPISGRPLVPHEKGESTGSFF